MKRQIPALLYRLEAEWEKNPQLSISDLVHKVTGKRRPTNAELYEALDARTR